MNALRRLPLYVLPLLLFVPSCGEGNPVAPPNSILTVSANPTRVTDLNGSATITIIGRKPDGNPLEEGTEVRLSVDGSASTGGGGGGGETGGGTSVAGGNSTVGQKVGRIAPLVTTDSQGMAFTTLFGDGRAGDARVAASVGNATANVTVTFGVTSADQPSLTLSPNPNDIKIGETSTISAITRLPDGSPLPVGETVRFFTSLGSIDAEAPVEAGGVARAILRSGNEPGTADIQAFVGSSDTATTMVTISRDAAERLVLQATPSSISEDTGGRITLVAIVRDDDGDLLQGAAVTFETGLGSLETLGVVTTDQNGEARNFVNVSSSELQGQNSFTVRAETAGAVGQVVEDSVNITVL